MKIVQTKYSDLEILKSWIPDQESSYFWCGPWLRFPFTDETFLEDIFWGQMPTYSLHDESKELIGFGQYYEKCGRCHLARLAISPLQRSKGIGKQFIYELMQIGMADLVTDECSLFVVNFNKKALNCYRSLNYKKESYPPSHKYFNDIDFMVYKSA